MKFEVTILGNSSASPSVDRHPSAQVLNHNEKLFLIDCGEGTQHRMMLYGVKLHRVDHIFITHLHGDHYFGLIGLLSSMNLTGRTKPLYLYAPEPLKQILDVQIAVGTADFGFITYFHALRYGEKGIIFENDELSCETVPLYHRVPCMGFLFKEKPKPRKINKEKVEALKIPKEYLHLIKAGIDFQDKKGILYRAHDLTSDPDPLRSYAYCSDTQYSKKYFDQIKNVSLLYHESTFTKEYEARATETMHSTAEQAAKVAKAVNAKKLLIGHFSTRYKLLEPLLEEAKSVYPNTEIAKEGQTFCID